MKAQTVYVYRRPLTGRLVLSIVTALAALTAPAAYAQPESGIDPVVLRLNGCDAITQDVLPALVSSPFTFSKDKITLLNAQPSLSLFGFTVTAFFKSSLENIAVSVPVDEDTIVAAFQVKAAPKAKFGGDFSSPQASFSGKLKIKTGIAINLPNFIPVEIRNLIEDEITISDSFTITVTGVSVDNYVVTLKKSSGSVKVDTVNAFTPQVGSVSVTDSAGLVALANQFLVAINQVFNVSGASNVNQAATKLANAVLKDHVDLKGKLKTELNKAIKDYAKVVNFSGSLPNTDLIGLDMSYALATMSSRVDSARTDWNITVESPDGDAFPGVDYTYLDRCAENLNNVSESGDLQAFLPLSLFDKTFFELAQTGLFDGTITINPNVQGLPPTLSFEVEPNGVPRAESTPGQAQKVTIVLPIKITNSGPSGSNVPQLNNIAATMKIRTAVNTSASRGLQATIEAITLTSVSGTVTLNNVTVQASQLASLMQTQILDTLVDNMPTLTLVPKVMKLNSSFSLSLGSVSVGCKYVRVPLTLVAN